MSGHDDLSAQEREAVLGLRQQQGEEFSSPSDHDSAHASGLASAHGRGGHGVGDNLVRMANQIGQFFDAMPDREEALRDIASHIRRFWAPSMRKDFLSHLSREGDDGLLPIVRQAVARHVEQMR